MGYEEFFNWMAKTLGINIDDVLKEDFVKGKDKPSEKYDVLSYFN